MTWWQRFLNWLTGSTPGGRKEQVEDWLAANQPKLQAFRQRQLDRFAARGHYFQRLKGWLRPTDESEDPVNDFEGVLPAWVSFAVDVREEPVSRIPRTSRKAYTLHIYVEEADLSKWVLSYDSEFGLVGWREIINVPLG